jgi:PII-like signaling protein
MVLPAEGHLLRIFIGEQDRHEGMPLWEWILRQAKQFGLAGATVLRGIAGFGAHSRIHTARLERLSVDLPIIIEIMDTIERIEAFLPIVDSAITEGLATIERVHIRFYRAGNRTPAGA